MPELPEVETVKRGLSHLMGPSRVIESVSLSKKALRFPYPNQFSKKLKNFEVEKLERRSKYLLFVGQKRVLVNHLGMTGNWRESDNLDRESHDHVLIKFNKGLSLVYNDVRRFGFFDLVSREKLAESRWFQHLGPEPLPPEKLHIDDVVDAIKRRRSAVKSVIMDAKVIVGVGNIYASEALFRAGIRPQIQANRISKARLKTLVKCIQEVLAEAIESGGSTIKDFKDSGGSSGYFQTQFNVYGKSGSLCRVCDTPIRSEMITGRNTFWCPSCQS
ncbi:MAG: bifunctional DNA-formamidopyrimidine glycosylase/DNA-(apurinic or apyrimidinic site) lyase [Pseudomonadota bacterium]